MAGKVSSDPNVFLLPDLGEGLEEAELIEWCVEVGQKVSEFDTIAKVETDKALADVPADRAGTIAQLHGKPGQRIKVHAPFVTYKSDGSEGKPAAPIAAAVQRTMEPDAQPHAEKKEEEREDAGTVVGTVQNSGMMEAGPGRIIATPAVRRIARDLHVDLAKVNGTGIGGRVVEADVRAFADRNGGNHAITPMDPQHSEDAAVAEAPPSARPPMRESRGTAPKHAAPDTHSLPPPGASQRIPFRGMRRTIAERLRQSVNNAVHFTVMDEADVSALDEQRRRLIGASGEKISFLPFVAAAVCRVLSGRMGAVFNRLNSTVDDAAQEIVQHRSVHLGIAADTDNGLMVPVIKDADKLGVLEIQRRINALAKAARDRTIPRDQLMGSTFTISNVGSLAGRFATPIINYPEAGILAVGRAREGVVVRNGMIGVGKILPLSLAADHRVIDGAAAATALAKIIELLQTPESLMPAR
ncbi:MAG: 2-oxo acid dehydrogenase subunit E2 [Anaerolineae bacterium]|nr:2-oxo acid dehydrogenase subunit E2 [Phycisphaerae bacterium]